MLNGGGQISLELDLATPPASTLELSLSLSLHLSIGVCKTTGCGLVGWLGLEEIMSKDPSSLCDPRNCLPTLGSVFSTVKMGIEDGSGAEGNG